MKRGFIAELREEISKHKREITMFKGIKKAMPDHYYVKDMDYNVILWLETIQELTDILII